MQLRNINIKSGEQLLEVEIRNKRGLIFSGTASAISSRNAAGRFDVLPMHANFITLVNETITIHKKAFGGDEIIRDEFPVQRGVIKVSDNKVAIFLSI